MANHKGYVFLAPDGRYLCRSILYEDGQTTTTIWTLTRFLDTAELFPSSRLDPIRPEQGFDDLAEELDVQCHQLNMILTPVPARSIQRIEIGHYES